MEGSSMSAQMTEKIGEAGVAQLANATSEDQAEGVDGMA
jgi:hypothetical protein